MKNKRFNTWSIVLCVSLFIMIILSIISSALNIGERFGRVNKYLEYLFYIMIGIILIVGIIYPMISVFFAPVFSLRKIHDKDGRAKKHWCKKLVANLKKNVELTDEEKETLEGYLKCKDETDDLIIEFFDRKIAPEVNKEAFDTARKIFLITAVSQNSTYDMLGMASANISLIKRIVEICGFRPSTPQVLNLYLKVMSITILAGGLEEINIEELLPLAAESSISKITGIVAASATQGAINALTTLRVAMITKNYLLDADVSQSRKELRKKSYSEAYTMLKELLKNGMEDKVKKPFTRFFSKKNEVLV
ncbi:MAG: DUF697 domain-containing protein [Lachnospiraceae bacterium]|nr:DUF697 domain-containing protein [Lachnospiraceae bacterium]